jgi:hypothetical protein
MHHAVRLAIWREMTVKGEAKIPNIPKDHVRAAYRGIEVMFRCTGDVMGQINAVANSPTEKNAA